MAKRNTHLDKETPFTKKDAMIGYKLFEQESPFPRERLRKAVPLSWLLAQGVAGGLSLDPGCEYTHLFTQASLPCCCCSGDCRPRDPGASRPVLDALGAL
jgi:hypothetical protein